MTSSLPILARGDCFYYGDRAGAYNPRVDAIILLPSRMRTYERPYVLAHEGKGHRGIAIQASLFRVERYFAGLLYSKLNRFLHLVQQGNLRVDGDTLDNLQIKPTGERDNFLADISRQAANVLLDIVGLHRLITNINSEVRFVYEVIAKAWTVHDVYKHLPPDQAHRIERAMLADATRGSGDVLKKRRFLMDYQQFRTIAKANASISLILGTYALDVGTWTRIERPSEKHIEEVCDYRTARFESILRWANGVPSVDVINCIKACRAIDIDNFENWRSHRYRRDVFLDYFNYAYQYPFRLMCLLDYILANEWFHGHECDGDLEKCVEVLNRSLVTQTVSGMDGRTVINSALVSAGMEDEAQKFVSSIVDEPRENAEEFSYDTNVLHLSPQWYLSLLMFEAIYRAVADGGLLDCPMIGRSRGCKVSCRVRRYFEVLAGHSSFSVGPLCPLADD